MRLTDYSLDDLHAAAMAEFENDPEVTAELTAIYRLAQGVYIERVRAYREKANRDSAALLQHCGHC